MGHNSKLVASAATLLAAAAAVAAGASHRYIAVAVVAAAAAAVAAAASSTAVHAAAHGRSTSTDDDGMSQLLRMAEKARQRAQERVRHRDSEVLGMTPKLWLEALDERHRYGSLLYPYWQRWELSRTELNFFKWRVGPLSTHPAPTMEHYPTGCSPLCQARPRPRLAHRPAADAAPLPRGGPRALLPPQGARAV